MTEAQEITISQIKDLIKKNNNFEIFKALRNCSDKGSGEITKQSEYDDIVNTIIKQYAKAGVDGKSPPTFINWVHKHIPSFSKGSIICLQLCFNRFKEEALLSWNKKIEQAKAEENEASTSGGKK